MRSRPAPIVSAMLAFASALALTACSENAPDEPQAMPIANVQAGACFDVTDDRTTALVAPNCQFPHDYESLGAFTIDAPTYPGADAIARRAAKDCSEFMLAYTGLLPSQAPELRSEYFAPSEAGWSAGDHAVLCVVARADGSALSQSVAQADGDQAP